MRIPREGGRTADEIVRYAPMFTVWFGLGKRGANDVTGTLHGDSGKGI